MNGISHMCSSLIVTFVPFITLFVKKSSWGSKTVNMEIQEWSEPAVFVRELLSNKACLHDDKLGRDNF